MFPHDALSIALAILPLLLLSMVMPQINNAETARMEIYSRETLTLTDKQFLLGEGDGKPVRMGEELRLPPGTARIPALIRIDHV